VEGVWNWRRPLRGREIGEFEDLLREIQPYVPHKLVKDKEWWWLGRDDNFTYQNLKWIIEEMLGEGVTVRETSWLKLVPKKVGVFMWRVKLGRIPCRVVLDRLGIYLNSILRPRCGEEIESIEHALVKWDEVFRLLKEVIKWWNLPADLINSTEDIFSLEDSSVSDSSITGVQSATMWAILYFIWSHRNQIVFKEAKRSITNLFLDLQRRCFEWISKKCRGLSLDWSCWLTIPELAATGVS